MLAVLDATLGKWLRHFFFVLIRTYYALFYNVSCANKHLLQGQHGTLILATHVSRHDGPLISALLYSTMRIRPTVHYNEYYNWLQWFPMMVAGAIPMSSPKQWPEDKRKARKDRTLHVIHTALAKGDSLLLFPAGRIRRQEREIVEPYLSGVHEIIRAEPETPLMLLKIDGLGQFQFAKYDLFWSFLGIKNGRRHVSVTITPIEGLDASMEREAFNQHLENLLND
ncbi:MAG: 1-acyl-sn-glycerol-3-phosphate acyltransferase [Pseudomonadota bacterium]